MTSMVASAAALVTGLPPKVERDSPLTLSAISGRVMVPPMGTPLAMPLAKVMTSGSTSHCSMPNILPPVRPQPVCTSSQMNRPPYLCTMSATSRKYSLGGVMKPPTPWMGSAMKAATLPDVAVWMAPSRSLAHLRSQLGYVSPNGQR